MSELEVRETDGRHKYTPARYIFPAPIIICALSLKEVQRPATYPIIFPFIEEALLRH